MEKIMEYAKKYIKYIGLGGGALMVLGCILPFIKVSIFGMSKTASLLGEASGDYTINGWIILIVALASIALVWFNQKKYLLIPNIACVVLALINGINITKDSYGLAHLSIGFYAIILGAIVSSLFVFIKEK